MTRTFALVVWVTASAAFAQQERSVEGMGRIAVQGGYRWTPNSSFAAQAASAGHPLIGRMNGGPQFSVSFGYAALDWLEASIDAFVGFEQFRLEGLEQFTSTSYGALLGVRIEKMDFPFRGVLPYLGAQIGPALAFIASHSVANSEKLNTGISVNAGLTFRVAEKWGLGFDARYLFGTNGEIPDLGSIDGGGLWISLTVTFFIGAGPKDPMGGML